VEIVWKCSGENEGFLKGLVKYGIRNFTSSPENLLSGVRKKGVRSVTGGAWK